MMDALDQAKSNLAQWTRALRDEAALVALPGSNLSEVLHEYDAALEAMAALQRPYRKTFEASDGSIVDVESGFWVDADGNPHGEEPTIPGEGVSR